MPRNRVEKKSDKTSNGQGSDGLIREFDLFPEVGVDIPRSISEIHYKGTVPAIKQIFIYNPWDADANNVWININPNYIIGRDDGTAMGPDEVRNFTRIGGSIKSGKGKYSPGGRRRYGEMGFATKMLPKVCKHSILRSWKDGVLSVVEQDHSVERLRTDVPAKVRVYRADPKLRGTEIQLEDLTLDSDFSVDGLIKRLQWEIMILPDFKVFVNDYELVSKPIENATPYKFEANGEFFGSASGMIYITTRQPALPGVFVYVNGRAIGDSHNRALRLTTHQGLVRKMIGVIHADGLSDAIMLGSEQFKEGDPGVNELNSRLREFLLQVRQEYDKAQAQNKVQVLTDRLPTIVDEVRSSFVGNGFSEMKKPGSIRVARNGENVLVENPVSVGKDGAVIINPNSPVFHIDPNTSVRELQARVFYHAIDVLALQRLGNDKSLRAYFRLREGLLNRFFGLGESVGNKPETSISPIQMYSALDLSKHSTLGMSPRAIREFALHGALKSDGGNIVGRDFLEFEKSLRGFTSLSDVVFQRYTDVNPTVYLDRVNGVLKRAGNFTMPFIYDLSRNSEPCYIVDSTCIDDVICLVENVDLRKANANPGKDFGAFRDSKFTPDGLIQLLCDNTHKPLLDVSYSKRIDPELIPRVISYAKNSDLALRGTREGYTQQFCFGDFLYAYQLARGCDFVKEFGYEQMVSQTRNHQNAAK